MSTSQIHITLKPTLLDTQGATVLKALHQLGHQSVRDVRIGKLIEVQLDDNLAPSHQQAEIETMCRQLLANPVIEDFSVVLNDNAQSSTRSETPIAASSVSSANVNVNANATSANVRQVTETSATPNVPIVPIASTQPIGSEPTTISDPFAVSFETYASMTAEEQLDLQGRAWNLYGTSVLNELNARNAAWIIWCGDRVLESGATLDSLPSDEFLAALGAKTDFVPFVFTRPPQ